MTYLRLVLLAVLAALGTLVLGWWWVPVVGIVAELLPGPRRWTGLEAGVAAALGWSALLAWNATQGPVWLLAQRVGPIFRLPALGFLAATLLFPALLAASTAELCRVVLHRPASDPVHATRSP